MVGYDHRLLITVVLKGEHILSSSLLPPRTDNPWWQLIHISVVS